MNGIYGLENSNVRTNFYPDLQREKNFSPIEIVQQNQRQEKNVPEDVSELFKNADDYSPIPAQKFARQNSQLSQDRDDERQLKDETERQDKHYYKVEIILEGKHCLQVVRAESHEKFQRGRQDKEE